MTGTGYKEFERWGWTRIIFQGNGFVKIAKSRIYTRSHKFGLCVLFMRTAHETIWIQSKMG